MKGGVVRRIQEGQMSDKHCTYEFRVEAIKQITERGHLVQSVAANLNGASRMS